MADSRRTAKSTRHLATFAFACLFVAVLYVARSVFIPISLAILLSLGLAPIVVLLQRTGLKRTPAVTMVVVLTLLLFGGLVEALSADFQQLAVDLPKFKDKLTHRIHTIGVGKPGTWDHLLSLFDEFDGAKPRDETAADQRPVPVTVTQQYSNRWTLLSLAALPAMNFFGGVSLTLGLTISILLKREDLRDRVLRLAGPTRLTNTTRMLEEASKRISRYLLIQTMVNLAFGGLFGVGLALIGIPYSLIWGVLAAILRFVPYIGAWLAAAPPVFIAFAVFDSWIKLTAVLLLVLVLVIGVNSVLERRLVSRSTGISPIALVTSAAFWTWMWGPVGLVLATPITACLGALGRHVRQLNFLHVLIGNEPALGPQFSFYQRLLARDEAEASELLETYLEEHTIDAAGDKILLPTLVRAQEDFERGELGEEDLSFILAAMEEILNDLVPAMEKTIGDSACVLAFPARDPMDVLALQIFQRLVAQPMARMEIMGSKSVAAELLQRVIDEQPAAVVIGAVTTSSLSHARYLCKRLRLKFPELPILVGCWTPRVEGSDWDGPLLASGATEAAGTMAETRDKLLPLLTFARHREPSTTPVLGQA